MRYVSIGLHFSILGGLVVACAPAQKPAAQVSFQIKSAATSNAMSISEATPIPNEFCYVIYTTNDQLPAPQAGDVAKDCPGSGGQAIGMFGRAAGDDTEVAFEGIANHKYRFDLLGIRKSWLAAHGISSCTRKFDIEFQPTASNGHDTFFFVQNDNGDRIELPEPPIRQFARGDAQLVSGNNTVNLVRTLDAPDYRIAIATDSDIGSAFSCQTESAVFPWPQSAQALSGESINFTLGDRIHEVIRTANPNPPLQVRCPADATSVQAELYVNGTSVYVGGGSPGWSTLLECPPSETVSIANANLNLDTRDSLNQSVILSVKFYSPNHYLVHRQDHRLVYTSNASYLAASTWSTGSTASPTFAGATHGYALVNDGMILTRIPLTNMANIFGEFPSLSTPSALLTLSGTNAAWYLNPLNGLLYDNLNGFTSPLASSTALNGNAWTSGNLTSGLGTTYKYAMNQELQLIFSNNSSYADLTFHDALNSSAIGSAVATSIPFSSISRPLARVLNVGTQQHFFAFTGNVASYSNAYICFASTGLANCANDFTHVSWVAPTSGDYFTEFFVNNGNLVAYQLSDDTQNSQSVAIDSSRTVTAGNTVAASTFPVWLGTSSDHRVRFMKALSYRESSSTGWSDNNQLIAGGSTLCGSGNAYECAVLYRSLDGGSHWYRVYLGAQGTRLTDGYAKDLPASFISQQQDTNNYHSAVILIEQDISTQDYRVLTQTPYQHGF